jgi:cytoskeletal protein RodZ
MNMTQAAYQNDKNALGVTYETAALVGSRLRQAREHKKLSPSQVSARVKIRDRYIEAIEIGDWDVLPPGLNGRGLIRLYARELSVSIPEFEAFHHLQTVMVEKQSESLMAASSKKSKYHPAAEESAEVIRSISRSDFQKSMNLDQSEYTVAATGTDDSNVVGNPTSSANSKVYSRPVFSQRTMSSSSTSIVTPNIYEVLGIEIEENKIESSRPEFEMREVPHSNQNLPTAEPVKRTFTEVAPAQAIHVQTPFHHEAETGNNYKKEFSFHSPRENTQEKGIKKKIMDLNPLQIIVALGFVMVFIFVSLFLFSKNSNQIRVTNLSAKQIESDIGESEPLPNSIVDSNIPSSKEGQKPAEYPPQTKTVAEDAKSVASVPLLSEQKVSHVLEVERIAKLNIASKVHIVIEADGQQIFSGVHASGIIDIPFKNKAEILISDASKVSLIYEGINHGSLGYAGRKRKITLNAKPYVE